VTAFCGNYRSSSCRGGPSMLLRGIDQTAFVPASLFFGGVVSVQMVGICELANKLIISIGFFVDSLGFSPNRIMPSANKDNFTSNFGGFYFLFSFIALAR